MKTLAFYVMSALLICGCATEPRRPPPKIITRARVESFIVKGKTTKAEILNEFGWPSSTTTQSMAIPGVNPDLMPYETLVYSKVYSVFPSEVAVLMVQLDKHGIVIGYTFTNTGVLTEGVRKSPENQ